MINKYLIRFLAFSGLFFISSTAIAEVVYRDKVVYKVGQTVFSLKDLEQNFQDIHNLKCMYSNSLLAKIFSKEISQKNKIHFAFQKELSTSSREFFESFIHFSNILVYSKSQSVVVNKEIIKFFYLTAKQNKCDLSSFENSKSFNPIFRDIVRLEVFVRSRFLPTDKGGKTTSSDLEKAINSAKNLLKSINRQIENEFYW